MAEAWLAVYNTFAGSAAKRRRTEALLARLEERAPSLVRIHTDPEQTGDLVRAALHEGVTRCFVLGGDGSVGDVAGALTGTDVPLAIVPSGTANVVALELGTPKNAFEALDALAASGRWVEYHTWSVGGRTVLLGASAGFDAEVMRRTSSKLKGLIGPAAVGLAGLSALLGYDQPEMVCEWQAQDDVWQTDRGHFVIAVNTKRYGGPVEILPEADPSDDLLDVMIGERRGRVRTAAFWMRAYSGGGRQLRQTGVKYVRAKALRVRTERGNRVPVQVNGDPAGFLPLDVEPGGVVKLLLPATVPGAGGGRMSDG